MLLAQDEVLPRKYDAYVASIARDNTAIVWPLELLIADSNSQESQKDQDILEREIRFLSHEKAVWHIKFHPKKPNVLATGANDGTVRVWDVYKPKGQEEIKRFKGGDNSLVHFVEFHPKNPDILVAVFDKRYTYDDPHWNIVMWDISQP